MRPEDIAEVERVMKLSDEEVKAELIKDGHDPQKVAADARAAFERMVEQLKLSAKTTSPVSTAHHSGGES